MRKPGPGAYPVSMEMPPAYAGHSIGVPPPGYPPHVPPCMNVQSHPLRWSTGLCHCCDDPANCLITCCCPCVTFGQIAELIDKGTQSCPASGLIYALLGFTGLACLYSCFYRSKLRAQYNLEESPCVDCLVHFCCEPYALCQEYRELKARGLDMGIGWQANMERRNGGPTAPPVAITGMTR